MIKDVEYNIRNDKVLHADFFAPDADEKLVMKIKVHYTGTPAGVLKGGFKKERNNEIKIKTLLMKHEAELRKLLGEDETTE